MIGVLLYIFMNTLVLGIKGVGFDSYMTQMGETVDKNYLPFIQSFKIIFIFNSNTNNIYIILIQITNT